MICSSNPCYVFQGEPGESGPMGLRGMAGPSGLPGYDGLPGPRGETVRTELISFITSVIESLCNL